MDWFRWHHGTVTDPKFRVIARRSGQPLAYVLSVWALFLERASQSAERGWISGWDVEDIAAALDLGEDQIRAIYDAMQGKTLDGDYLTGWGKRQPKREREDNSTDRVKAHRERQKSAISCYVTPCNATSSHETPRGEEIREEKIDSYSAAAAREDKPEVKIIAALDVAIVAAFGPEQARPWPDTSDMTHAKRFVQAGGSVEVCEEVFRAICERRARQGQGPPTSLRYFEKPIADAIAAAAKPMEARNGTPARQHRHDRQRPGNGFCELIATGAIAGLHAGEPETRGDD